MAKNSPIKITFLEQIQMVARSTIKPYAKNPRKITNAGYEELYNNIKRNPNMLRLKPLLIDNGIIKAGNQRYRVCEDLDIDPVPIIDMTKMSKKEKHNVMLWDNHNSGKWDLPELAKLSDLQGLEDLLDKKNPERYTDENAQMPIVPMYDEKHRAVLIVIDTESDFANICTMLGLGKMKDYKSSKVGQSSVISFKDFIAKMNAWKKSK